MKIEMFVPPKVSKAELNMKTLESLTGKHFLYASKGRHAIGHIINILKPRNKTVLISPYMCDSVHKKLDQMGMETEYYDIDPLDLNPSPTSIEDKLKKTGAGTVIAASLYGNPADMEAIESICKEQDAVLIDDAAQSFGAELNGRYIGCFGDGGLFAFSPGKATPGHMGALFWTEKDQDFKRTHHALAHKAAWWDYKNNRIGAYENGTIKKRLSLRFNLLMQKLSDIENDDIEEFESGILGGILSAQINDSLYYRLSAHKDFLERYSDNGVFRIVHSRRGTAKTHKNVIVFNEIKDCESFKSFLDDRQIAYYPGYNLSSKRYDSLDGCVSVRDCIVELPIEDNFEHMGYIFETVDLWLDENNK